MPSFCRHGRFFENCPICSKVPRVAPAKAPAKASAPRAPRTSSGGARRSPAASRRSGDVVVRRQARAADDGYGHELVPGLRASADAVRLAQELAFAAARLDELSSAPAGLLETAATAGDVEDGLWLAFLIAFVSPLEGVEDPWAAVAAVASPWSAPVDSLAAAVPAGGLGPRAGTAERFAEAAALYRSRAEKAGGQHALLSGEPTWEPQRRFDRAYERLALPGFGRAPRFEFLVLCGRLGLAPVEAGSLQLNFKEALDPMTVAAKRVFGIGDPVLVARRASALAAELEVPLAALDLGLQNWQRPAGDRIRAGSLTEADPSAVRRLRAVLGVPDDDAADDA